MFKNIISPVQAWLLSQGRCVGCGTPLRNGKKSPVKNNGDEHVSCKKCGRVFLYDQLTKRYKRAPISVRS